MMRKVFASLVWIAACSGSPSTIRSQRAPSAAPALVADLSEPGELPSADRLYERWVEVSGGRAQLLNWTGYRATGRFQGPQGKGTVLVLARRPDRLRSILTLESGDVFEHGFDGDVAWVKAPRIGTRILKGRASEEAQHRADFFAPARMEAHFPVRNTLRKVDFGGREAWVVRAQTDDTSIEEHFFDVENGRLLGVRGSVLAQERQHPLTVTFGDWRTVGGFEVPFAYSVETDSGRQVTTFESFSVDDPQSVHIERPRDSDPLSVEP